jgi:hypothetical protein
VDDKARLKCFDDLFSTKRGEAKQVETARSPSNWSNIEGDLNDDDAQFSAGVVVGDAALILRCKEKKTELSWVTKPLACASVLINKNRLKRCGAHQ